ncbi:MAG: D-alanine--D-alanine ligase [Clostridiales Family XIII bacterium]|jgi:D-alanine-D-alanine ligase|nr:D-alanine--D-alanine ligase [Clostridiales Family XIII bacterium]
MEKDRIAVLFGGRSQEHEISILSAASVMGAIDCARHDIVPVGIAKDGNWYRIHADMRGIEALDDPRIGRLIPDGDVHAAQAERIRPCALPDFADLALPILHGPYGEDGTVQGLFEMVGLPYAGCGVAGSAIAMDKLFTKELLLQAGIPVLPHAAVTGHAYRKDKVAVLDRVQKTLDFPVFVKPANLGSSVGVGRAADRAELADAIETALRYDERVIVEREAKGRELETAVLGNDEPEVGEVGEICFGADFYDYETKYRTGAQLQIPADIPADVRAQVRDIAADVFRTLGGSGFARVDFFWEEAAGNLYVNEMNTIPGCTKYSMFPRLWEAAGIGYEALIERIVRLGYERHNAKNHG